MNLPDILSENTPDADESGGDLPEEDSTEYHEVVYLGGEPGITAPYQEEIVYEALEEMKKIDQQEIAEKKGIEDPRLVNRIKVEYNFSRDGNELEKIVKEFGKHVSSISEQIAEQIIEREDERDNTNPFERADGYMTYIIEKTEIDDVDVIIFGGANSVVFSLCDDLGFTSDDRRLIIKSNEVAAKYSNIAHHTEVESVLFAPIKSGTTSLDEETIQEHEYQGEKEDVIR